VVRTPAPPPIEAEAEWLTVMVHGGRRWVHRVAGPDALSVIATLLLHYVEGGSSEPRVAAPDWQIALGITERVTAVRASSDRFTAGALRSMDTLGPGAPLPTTPPPHKHRSHGRHGVRQRVLELPTLTELEVQALFQRQRDLPAVVRGLRKAGVIASVRHNGQHIYRAFQFEGARPHPIVAAVNLLLGADIDSWAALTWWVQHNNELGCRPLDLLPHRNEADGLLTAAGLASRA
jgi:hypothetical protein